MKSFTPAIVLAVLMLGSGLAFSAEDIVLRTSMTPEVAWVGQRVLLHVDVLAADGWAQIAKAGDLEIPGAYVLRTESQGTRLNETIGGKALMGQRYEISLYCQRAGRVDIPAMPVTVAVKQWGAQPAETRRELRTPPTHVTCKVPPGAEGIRGLISTTGLSAGQVWSAQPDTVDLGDAITRTVTLRAEDVSAMAFPPMQHPEREGLGVYPGEPSVADETNRGALRGERVETVTYVFEQPGEVILPDIVLPWWNIKAQTLRQIELPGLALVVVGEPVQEAASVAVEEQPAGSRGLLLIGVAVTAIVALGFGLGRVVHPRWRRWRNLRRESEAAYFKRLESALRGGDPAAISGAMMRWLDRLDPGMWPARLDLFLHDHGDDATRAAAGALAHCLAGGEKFTEIRTLGGGLKRARRHHLQTVGRELKASEVLPELNGRLTLPG
ncbi:MAG: hypothetical protein ABFS42_08335 [Candidatus Krumholzibacteriota bacterium]